MLLRAVFALAASASLSLAASLQQVSSFGENPTKIQMYIYVPAKLAEKPPVVVAVRFPKTVFTLRVVRLIQTQMHGCMASASGFYAQTKLPSYADKYGFILIYPSTPNQNNCWDVQNPATLTHGGAGDAKGIISMINYTLDKYKGDAAKVFVLGSSSGAMMTNVMVATYPEVFEAGAAYSGVAHACFAGAAGATPMSPNQTCAQGLQHTPQEWAQFVRNSYPSYTGKRPRMQIWHGYADTLVRPQCAFEALKQWSAVLGLQNTKNNTGVPSSAYTQLVYGDGTQLMGFFGQGVGHVAPVNEEHMLKFFGIMT